MLDTELDERTDELKSEIQNKSYRTEWLHSFELHYRHGKIKYSELVERIKNLVVDPTSIWYGEERHGLDFEHSFTYHERLVTAVKFAIEMRQRKKLKFGMTEQAKALVN